MSTANSPAKIACPHCQGLLKAPALALGSAVTCPKCGKAFRLGEGKANQKSEVGGQRSAGGNLAAAPVKQGEHSTKYSVPSTRPEAAAQVPSPPLPTEQKQQAPRPTPANPKSKIEIPKSKPPDNLVDPNLLPPPPPVVKPKPKEVAVICPVCNTRMYAPLEKIGQKVKCPDCHTECEVKAAPAEKKGKPTGPTLEGAEEYAMSDPGERPAYRPLVVPRGEDEILSALERSGNAQKAVLRATPQAAAEEDDEFKLEAPVERVELRPEPVKLPDPEPEDKLYDGKYDDGLIGENVDRRAADAWKKSPFMIGVAEFLIQPETLGRSAAYSVGLAILLNLARGTALAAASEDNFWKVGAVLLSMFSAVATALWVFPFGAMLLAIVEDTGNGASEVNNWPSWDPTSWFFPSLYVVGAAFISGLPGMLVTSFLVTSVIFTSGVQSSATAAVLLSLPLPLSWLVLFPLVLYSMLAENSAFAIYSRFTAASLRLAGEAWMLFYFYAAVLGLGALGALSLFYLNHWLPLTVGAVGLVVMAFLYARLLGRLLWYSGQQLAKAGIAADAD